MSEEQTVTYELDGEIALVGLNRPDKRNCFNPTVMKQLKEAIERAGEEAKCGIIFGHGDNFCAGLDLRWAAGWKPPLPRISASPTRPPISACLKAPAAYSSAAVARCASRGLLALPACRT